MILLGDKLKSLRKQKGLTQVEVAKRIGISKAVVSSYEITDRRPSLESLVKLAKLYDVSTDYLLGLEPRRNVDFNGLTAKQVDAVIAIVEAYKHP